MASSYKIPDNIKYHSPIYIHSHPKVLETDSAIHRIVIDKAKTEMQTAIDQTKSVIEYLKSISLNPTVQQFYNDTHNGYTRIHSIKAQALIDEFIKARQELYKIKQLQNGWTSQVYTEVEEFFVNWLISVSEKDMTLAEFMGDQIANDLSNFFKNEAKVQGFKKKYSNLNKNSTIKELLLLRKGKVTEAFKKLLRKWFNRLNAQGTDVQTLMDSLKNDVDGYINSFHDVYHLLMDKGSVDRLQHTIDSFNGHFIAKYAISGSGFTFEKFFNYVMLETILAYVLNGEFVVQLGNQQLFTVEGTSASNKGHHLTTDNIITFFDDTINELKIGFSLKATVDKNGANSKFSKKVYSDKLIKSYFQTLYQIPLQEQKELLYYLGNEVAFSVFLAPYNYDHVVKNISTGTISMPSNVARAKVENMESLVGLRNIVVMLCLIKGMLGSLFLEENFTEKLQNETPPILLSFLEQDYFTYQILEKVLSLVNYDFASVFSNGTNFKMSKVANIKMDDLNFNLDKNKLADLFLTKKMIESTNANRYDDLLNNQVDYPYLDIAPYLSLNEALSDVTKDITFKSVRDKILRPVIFHLAINDLLK